jgi:hypothetical protein
MLPAVQVPDIGLRVVRDAAGALGFEVWAGGVWAGGFCGGRDGAPCGVDEGVAEDGGVGEGEVGERETVLVRDSGVGLEVP